jgi:hypothetical protein
MRARSIRAPCYAVRAAPNLALLRLFADEGFGLASQYNTRPRPAEVLVDGADFRVVRRRETSPTSCAGSRLESPSGISPSFPSSF